MNTKDKERDPYELKDIYSEMEMELVRSFRRNLIKHGIDEYNAGFSWEMWQIALLRNMEQYRRDNITIIGKARPAIKDAIENVLKSYYDKGYKNTKESTQFNADGGSFSITEDGKNTGEVGKKPPQENKFFGMNEKKLNALVKTMKDDFKEVDKAIYRKMDDVYRQTVAKVEFQMSTGAMSLDKAIDKATEDFLDKGINCIVYKNNDGSPQRAVNIATYAEMCLRTASQRAIFLGEGTKRDELGVHLVCISAHANACELCMRWQGQILIDDVFSHPSDEYIAKYKRKYELLSTAIKEGLLHPNCRHTLFTYFEGITKVPKIVDNDVIMKNYAAEQKQRQLENKIRKAKRIAEGVISEKEHTEAVASLRAHQKALRNHLKNHPELKRRQHREKIYSKKGISSLLNEGERSAIKKYVSPKSYTLNDKLRNGLELNNADKKWMESLDSALKKMPTYKGTVTRSVEVLSKEDLNDFVSSHIIGNEKRYSQYLSSTKGSVYNEDANVQFEIISKTAKDISYYNSSEKEVLFKPNVNFVVVDKKIIEGVCYIKLEES